MKMTYNILFAISYIVLTLSTDAAHAKDSVDSAVEITRQTMSVTILKDGSAEETAQTTLKALNDKGRERLSLIQIAYSQKRESIEVLEAKVIPPAQSSNAIIPVPKSSIAIKQIANGPHGLTDGVQLNIPFEGVTLGASISYTYRRKIKPSPIAGAYFNELVYGLEDREVQSDVTIRSQIPLKMIAQNPQGKLVIENKEENGWFILQVRQMAPFEPLSLANLNANPLDLSGYNKVTRVDITTDLSWEQLQKRFDEKFKPLLSQSIPPEVKTFVASLSGKTEAQKISATRNWINDRITYSGRWTAASSDWIPRPIDEILRSKVADCKDFALLFTRILQELKIPATFTVVNAGPADAKAVSTVWFSQPLDDAKPLPALIYFNHAVVRVKTEGKTLLLDPTLKLSQAAHTDLHLNLKPIWILEPGTKGYSRWTPEAAQESTALTDVNQGLGGQQISSTIQLEGPLAQFIQSIRFGSRPSALSDTLGLLAGFKNIERFKIKEEPPADRALSKLRYRVEFFVQEQSAQSTAQRSHTIVPSFSTAALATADLGSPVQGHEFPYKLSSQTRIASVYTPAEETHDCLAIGPAIRYTRRVINQSSGVLIKESHESMLQKLSQLVGSEKNRSIFSAHVRDIQLCAQNTQLSLKPIAGRPADFKTFEDSVVNEPRDRELHNPETHRADLQREWRKALTLIERTPLDPEPHFTLARIYYSLSTVVGDIRIGEYLDEGRLAVERGLKIAPDSSYGWARLGINAVERESLQEASAAYQKAYTLNPKEFYAQYLGGRIAIAAKNYAHAMVFFRNAQNLAINPFTKTLALQEQIEAACDWRGSQEETARTCASAIPQIELYLQAKSTPWSLHNMAILYELLENYDRAIELERQALVKMKFGAAQNILAKSLAGKVGQLLKNAETDHNAFDKIEPLLQEALALDTEIKYATVQAMAVRYLLEKSRRNHDPLALEQAEMYLDRCRKLEINPKAIAYYNTELQRLSAIYGRRARTPTSALALPDPTFTEFEKRYARDTATEIGKLYDRKATEAIANAMKNSFDECYPQSGGFQIDAAVQVDAAGIIKEWHNKVDSPENVCIKERMRGSKTLAPPFAPFHVWMQIRIH